MLKKRLGLEAIERVWYSNENLGDYFKIPSTLIIPEGCIEIGECAFWECDKLRVVIIPEGCREIGEYAFEYCDRLKKVIVPVSIEYIGECAFEDCLEATIILKKSKKKFAVEFIGNCAFKNCKDVKEEVRN